MTLINRETVVDRPELVDRGNSEDTDNTDESNGVVEVLGEGNGPVVNRIQFEQGDYGVVAASNLVAVLSTAQTEGDEFEQAFMTSAIQMKEMVNSGVDISPIARMSRNRGIDDLNIGEGAVQELKLATQGSVSDEDEEDDVDGDNTNDEEDNEEVDSDDEEQETVESEEDKEE